MKPYQALIWNEWRQIRGSVMVLAVVTVLLWLLLLAGCFYRIRAEYIETATTALAIGLPLLYSVMLADSFAREFIQKTDSFLLEMPVSTTKIYFCKYFANLTVFIVLVLFESLLMSRMTRLSSGKSFTYGFQFEDWIIFIGIIASIWILAHAIVFFTSLLCKKSGNSITGIIIMPLLYVVIFPGTMAITTLFINDDNIWIISSILLTFILLYCSCMGFGWYLWTRRITCGKKIVKPVIVALSIILIMPWLLYGMVYVYFNHSFNSAIYEANAAGIETDIKKFVLPTIAPEQNAAAGISKFSNEYRQVQKIPEINFPSLSSWTGTKFNFKGMPPHISPEPPQETIFKTAEFILNDHGMNQCYSTLSEALKKPRCRNIDFNGAYTAVNFSSNRAYALRIFGRDDDFFSCLASIDKIAGAFAEQPFMPLKACELRLKIIQYQTAITAGPDTADAINFYRKMIREIDSINPKLPDEIFRVYDYLENISKFVIQSQTSRQDILTMKYITMECIKLFTPRKIQGAAAWVRLKIQRDKLLEKASACASIRIMESDVNSSQRVWFKIPGIFKAIADDNIMYYFRFRERFESYKLCLALKIYHVKYGKFPDSLQQLIPEILPKIPVNPLTGEDYIYIPEADGFRLSSNSTNSSYPISNIKYQTWKINEERAK